MKVKSESEVVQSCLTLSNLMDCSLPGSSVHGIFQARVLEWGAIAFSDWYPYKVENLETDRYRGSVSCEHENSHLQSEEKGLGRSPSSQSSEGITSPANTSVWDV